MPSSSLLLVTIEFVDDTVFSGNGVLSRTYAKEIAQNSKRHGIDRVDVLCARPINDDEYYSTFENNNKGDLPDENYGQWFTSGWIFGGGCDSSSSKNNNNSNINETQSSQSASSIKPIYTAVPVPESKWKRLDINSAVNEFASSSEKFVRFRNNKSHISGASSLEENEVINKKAKDKQNNEKNTKTNKQHDGSGIFNPLADIRHAFDQQRSRHFVSSETSDPKKNTNSNHQTATTTVFSETMQKLKDKEKIRDVYDYVLFVDWHGYFAFAALTGTRKQNIPTKTRVAFMNFRIFANKILFPEHVLRVDLAKKMEFHYYKQYEMAAVEQSDVTTVLSETDKELLQELCDDERRKIVSSIREQQGRRLVIAAEKNYDNDDNQQQQNNDFYTEDDDEIDRREKDARRKEDEALLKDPKNIHVLMCPLQESFISAAHHHQTNNNKKSQSGDNKNEENEILSSSSVLATNVRCLEDEQGTIITSSSNNSGITTKTFLLTCCVRLDPTKNAEAFADLVVDLVRRNNNSNKGVHDDGIDDSSSPVNITTSPEFFSLVRSSRHPNARLIPFLCGAAANADYAKLVKEKIRSELSKFSDHHHHHRNQNLTNNNNKNVNFIIRDDFVSPAELMKIFETSVLNVHPCLTDAYGMSVVESTAMGCLTLTHGVKRISEKNIEIHQEEMPSSEKKEEEPGEESDDDIATPAHQVKTSFDDIVILADEDLQQSNHPIKSNMKKPSSINLHHQRQQQKQLNSSINNNNISSLIVDQQQQPQQQVAEASLSPPSWETHVGACGLLKYDNGEIILADFTKSSSSSSSSKQNKINDDKNNNDDNTSNKKKQLTQTPLKIATTAEAVEPLLISCLERSYEQHEYQIGLIANDEQQQREEEVSSSSNFGNKNNNTSSSSFVNNNNNNNNLNTSIIVDDDRGFAPSRDARVRKLNKMVERGRNKALSYGPSEAIDLLMNILSKKKQ